LGREERIDEAAGLFSINDFSVKGGKGRGEKIKP